MTAIPERHREGVADWLDCRELLREVPDPGPMDDLRNPLPAELVRKGTLAHAGAADPAVVTACHELPAPATGGQEAPSHA